jgi:hypothetical protein
MSSPYEYDEEEGPVELAPWLAWPRCPLCAQRRQARCPTCGHGDDDFPLADYQELGAEPQLPINRIGRHFAEWDADPAVLLLCPHCEEAFRPRFYHHCAACGYDFGEGVQPDSGAFDDFSLRAFGAAAALLATGAAIFTYFWAILHG